MTDRYAAPLRALHWIIALAALCLVVVGFALKFDLVPEALHHKAATIHIGVGLSVLVLMLGRLAVRLGTGAPALPEAIPAPERLVARAVQAGFYVLLIAMPVAGVVFVQAHGHAVNWFGVFALPMLVGEDHGVSHLFATLHLVGGIALAVLMAAHVAGYVKNKRRGVLLLPRMWR
jgi:cytochrome b561